MDLRMTIEWDYETGILSSNVLSFLDKIQDFFKEKGYGITVSAIWIVVVCRPYDFKQRKRFKKDVSRLEYDILLDYYLIKNVTLEEKKAIIKRQVVEITEQTFSKYKFADFDKQAFLTDFKNIVSAIEW